MLEKHLQQLQKELELPEPFPNEVPGVWAIPLDADLAVFVTALKPQGFSLNCTLGPIPKENQEAFLDQVMLSNLFGQGTDGAILGIDEEEKNMVLAFHLDYDVEYQRFKDILEDFLNSVDVWKDEIIEQKK